MRIFIVAALAVLSVPALADDPPRPFTGKVVKIADGDTITVLLNKTQHKIRLEGIDAPEKGQAYGTKARQALADKIFGQTVRVEWTKRDRY
jgi:endonuclease YncB( thermonuclease family)